MTYWLVVLFSSKFTGEFVTRVDEQSKEKNNEIVNQLEGMEF